MPFTTKQHLVHYPTPLQADVYQGVQEMLFLACKHSTFHICWSLMNYNYILDQLLHQMMWFLNVHSWLQLSSWCCSCFKLGKERTLSTNNTLPCPQILLFGHEKGHQALRHVVYSAAIMWLFLFIHAKIYKKITCSFCTLCKLQVPHSPQITTKLCSKDYTPQFLIFFTFIDKHIYPTLV